MTPVFADSFYWIALINYKNSLHDAVLAYTGSLSTDAIVFTNYEALTELFAFCANDPLLCSDAGLIAKGLRAQTDVKVIPQSRAGFMEGLDLYLARPDKAYSLVDQYFDAGHAP